MATWDYHRGQHATNCICAACCQLREDVVVRVQVTGTTTNFIPVLAASALPTNSEIRKTVPLASGCFDYFPAALAAVAELSYWGNEKHSLGEPIHDARGKSNDDADCLLRHFLDRGKKDELVINGKQIKVRHSTCVAWRALRILQKELEADGAPLAPGAKL